MNELATGWGPPTRDGVEVRDVITADDLHTDAHGVVNLQPVGGPPGA